MTHFKRYDKRFNKLLWVGLTLWLGSILAMLIMEWCGVELTSQDTLMGLGKQMFQRSPIFCLLLLCLIAPALEECSFRLWGIGKTWSVIVCFALMAIFTCAEMKSAWWLLLIGGMCAVWFLVKDRYKKTLIIAIGASFTFTICHLSGFSTFSLGTFFGLLDIFGLALVLNYLTINFSFGFSILLHALNNSIAIIVPLLAAGDPIVLPQSNDYSVEITPIKALGDKSGIYADVHFTRDSTDHLVIVGELPEIAYTLYGEDAENPIRGWKEDGELLEARYRMEVRYNGRTLPNTRELYNQLMEAAELTTVTTTEEVYSLWKVETAEGADTIGCCLDSMDATHAEPLFHEMQYRQDMMQSLFWKTTDTATMRTQYRCVYKPNLLTESLEETYATMHEYRIKARPVGKQDVTLIEKTKSKK